VIGWPQFGKVVRGVASRAVTDSDCRVGGHAMTAADVRTAIQ
jgi:hypothetical protein